MIEFGIFAMVLSVAIVITAIVCLFECRGKCVHKWGDWRDDSTDDAYVQFRVCEKCGYTDREQWKKIKEKS